MLHQSSDFLQQSNEQRLTVNDDVKDDTSLLVKDSDELTLKAEGDSPAERAEQCYWSTSSPKLLNKGKIYCTDDEHSSDLHLSSSPTLSEDSGSTGATGKSLSKLLNVKRRTLYRSKSISFIPNTGNWRSSMKRRCHEDFTNPSSKTLRHSSCSRGSTSSCDYNLDLASLRDKYCDLSSSLCKVQTELEALKLSIQVENDSVANYNPGTITDVVKELYVAQKQWQSTMMSRLKLNEEIQTERIKTLADRLGCSSSEETVRQHRLDDHHHRDGNPLVSDRNDDPLSTLMDTKDRLDSLRMTYCLQKPSLLRSDEQSISPPETGFVTMSPSASTTPDSCGGPSTTLGPPPRPPSSSATGRSKVVVTSSSSSSSTCCSTFEKSNRPNSNKMTSSKSKKPFVYRGRADKKGQGSKKGHRGQWLLHTKSTFDAEAKCQRLERLVAVLRKKIRSS